MHYEPVIACGIYDQGLSSTKIPKQQTASYTNPFRRCFYKRLFCHLVAILCKAVKVFFFSCTVWKRRQADSDNSP